MKPLQVSKEEDRKIGFMWRLTYWLLLASYLETLAKCQQDNSITCRDKYPTQVCVAIRSMNNCNSVRENCMMTCGFCATASRTFQQNCRDSSQSCSSLAQLGFCNSDVNFPILCPESCNSCNTVRPATTPRAQISSPKPKTPTAVWTQWSKFGKCSKTCGRGVKARRRKCSVPAGCVGSSRMKESCFLRACSTELGQWGPWQKYGPCSVTCGRGKEEVRRTCSTNSCNGANRSMRRCRLKRCTGKWGPWINAGDCSKSCGGGTVLRRRQCLSKTCLGKSTHRKKCNVSKCSVTGAWGPWGKVGACTKSCGGGNAIRRRVCKGSRCVGPTTKTSPCNMKICPVNNNGGGRWSSCTKSCSVGSRYKFASSRCTDKNNPRCFRIFEECNTTPCQYKFCPAFGDSNRYKHNYACCSPLIGERILGGVKAEITQWPWMVAVITTWDNKLCGGTAIHQQWILTAAHCIMKGEKRGQLSEVLVYAGINRLSERFSSTSYRVILIVDPGYKALQNDIALLKLSRAIPWSTKSSPVDLPRGEITPIDSTCFATGWGLTNPNSPILRPSDPLMEVDLQILDLNMCRNSYKNEVVADYLLNKNNLICAGKLSQQNDVCQGDSGGPLVCQRCSNCQWYVAGITSFGPKGTCGKMGYPGMFTRVAAFESWIHSNIPSLKKSNSICSYKYGP